MIVLVLRVLVYNCTVESPQPSGSCRNVLGQRNHKSALAGMTLIDAGERAALMSVKS